MNQLLKSLLALTLFAGVHTTTTAQTGAKPVQQKSAGKPKLQKEEAILPPPPPAMAITFDTTSVVADDHTAEVRRLMETMQFKENFVTTVAQSLDQNLSRLSPDIKTKFKEKFMYELTRPQTMGWLENMYIRLYREYFTQSEVKELIQFYQSTLGKKFVATTPLLTTKVMEQASKIGEYIGAKVGQEIMNPNAKN